MKIKLRPVNWTADWSSLLTIEKESFKTPWKAHNFALFSLAPLNRGIVATLNGQVVGYMLYEEHVGRNHVAHIAVAKASRGQGIGTLMLQHLCAKSESVTLNVRRSNVDAQRLYQGLDFDVVRQMRAHYGDGEDALVMQFGGSFCLLQEVPQEVSQESLQPVLA